MTANVGSLFEDVSCRVDKRRLDITVFCLSFSLCADPGVHVVVVSPCLHVVSQSQLVTTRVSRRIQ